ncbi:GAF and ANTAR domain-containing protein [Nocardioides sp. WS12]|uniref:GAF and ANTAR domain-containing protein n=1 Tax=Nocardioides sp. WS12 TaxID=2486272 RepID=UPI0015FCE7D1|nr:GAF and ANTAR domain-containing protein [Nocardioides sp. WS12]
MAGDPDEFAEIALKMHDEDSLDETAERLLEYSLKAVSCSYAGVIFVHGGKRVETVVATHPIVEVLDQIQLDHGEGPDIDVLSDVVSIMVSDTTTESRWPDWGKRVAEVGIRSLLSVRLYTSTDTVGTLNLYDVEPNHFDVDDQAVAHILARHAAIALANARSNEQLRQAIDARKLIGQAQGILMERFDLNADQAFAVLLRYSQDYNVKLRLVAERLIATRVLPS